MIPPGSALGRQPYRLLIGASQGAIGGAAFQNFWGLIASLVSLNLIPRIQSFRWPIQFLAPLDIQNGEEACKRCRRPVRGAICVDGQDGRGRQLRRRCKFHTLVFISHASISLTLTPRTLTSSTSILSGSTSTPRLTSTASSSCSASSLTSTPNFLTYPRWRISYCRTKPSAQLSRSMAREMTHTPSSRRSI